MKKLFYLCAFVLFASCSDSNESIDATTSDFVGTWNLTNYEVESTSSTTYQGFTFSADGLTYGKDFDYTMTFSENPNEYTTDGEFTAVLEYDDGFGGTETYEYPVTAVDAFASGSWIIEDNKIIFEGQDASFGVDTNLDALGEEFNGITIKSVSDSRIVLEENISIDYEESYYGEDISYEIDIKMSITLEK